MICFKIKLLLWIFVVCSIIFDGCEANEHRHRRDHEHKDKKRHILHYANVTMPSGVVSSITTPYKFSQFKCGVHARLMTVNNASKLFRKEYVAIISDFMKGETSNLHFTNVKIEKIINPCLWSKYWWRKHQIMSQAIEANEMMLYHSSKYNWRNMNKGFDERYAKFGPYGAGLHFYSNSTKVHEYSKLQLDGTRTVLLCRVALGKITEIGPTNLAHAPVGYQSVKKENTEDYVVYRGEQAYPEYLITYKTFEDILIKLKKERKKIKSFI